MSTKKMEKVSSKMKNIDFCMMTTRDGRGSFDSRPMSSNGDIEYDGDSWFFAYDDSQKVQQIEEFPETALSFQGDDMVFIHVTGISKLLRDKELIKEHWKPQFKMWFPDGIETKGIVLIKVEAKKIKYWQKQEEFEIDL